MLPEEKRPLRVFLCHAHTDKDKVRALYSRLRRGGVDVWLDKEKLLPGSDWEFEIRKAVRDADVVVVCLSKQFNQAGFRQKEVRLALDTALEKPEGEIFIIPARLEDCDTLESLRKWHWVDLFEDDGYQNLIRALRARANQIGATLRIRRGRESTPSRSGIEKPFKDEKPEILEDHPVNNSNEGGNDSVRVIGKGNNDVINLGDNKKETPGNLEEQAKPESKPLLNTKSNEVVSQSVGNESDLLRHDSLDNGLKNSLLSYDPESFVVCSKCGNKVKAKNLSTHIYRNHSRKSIKAHGDALAKSATSNKQRNLRTRKDKRQPTERSTMVTVVFRISGDVDDPFFSKLGKLLIGLNVHYIVEWGGLLANLFSVFTKNTVRYTTKCFGVADLIASRLYPHVYRQELRMVNFTPSDNELREYGEDIVIFELNKSSFKS
jgi:hypothetical protein